MPDGSTHISSEGASQLNQALMHFSYLQVLDFLTTVAFLVNGVKEANPLVRLALRLCPNPIGGLILVKGLAIVLGKKGQAIRLTYVDTRSHRVSAEAALACHAGSPTAIKLDDGKPANPAGLIEQFIAEKTKQR